MRTRAFTVVLVVFAAAGGVVAWQRKHETPPVAPGPRPAEPFMDPAPQAEPAVGQAAEPPAAVPGDDLTRITGIGPTLERLLHEQGITTFRQLASLDDAQVDDLQATLHGFPGRIRRDDWVGQASRLLGG